MTVAGAHEARWLRWLGLALALAVWATALWFGWVAIETIATHGWRDITFDQWRQYPPLIDVPFPANLFVLENGHRFVVPNLLTLLDIHAFDADQRVLLIGSALSSLAIVAVFLRAALRDSRGRADEPATTVLLAVFGVLWLLNARMLVHGNDSTQVHLAAAAAVFAAYAVHRASVTQRGAWIAAALLSGVVATFSFGSGIATFPALLLLAWACGVRGRLLAAVAAGFGAMVVLYVAILPGASGVRGSMVLAPLESAAASLRWLGAPMVHGWLGLAPGAPLEWMRDLMVDHGIAGRWLVDSADWLAGAFGTNAAVQGGSFVFGLLGIAWLATETLLRLWRPRATGATEAVAFGTALFCAAVAVLIGIVRLGYFRLYPDQVFADRYQVWTCLFWAALALLGATRLWRSRRAFVRLTPAVCALLLAWLLAPSTAVWRVWAGAANAHVERAAIAFRLGIVDAELQPPMSVVIWPERLQRMEQLARERGLGPFRDPLPPLGHSFAAPPALSDWTPLALASNRIVRVDQRTGERWIRFALELPARLPQELPVVDARGTVVGAARWTAGGGYLGRWPSGSDPVALYEGFVRESRACPLHTITAIDASGALAPLATVAACADAR